MIENLVLLFCTFVLICTFFFMSVGIAQAACMPLFPEKPVWGTGDTAESCRYKMKQDQEEQRIERDIRDRELQQKRYNMSNGISGNNNVILGLPSFMGGSPADAKASGFIVQTKFQIRIESMFGVKTDSKYFNSIRPPDEIPLAVTIALEYYVSPNMSFGFLGQKYSVSGAKGFDPIRDSSGDILYFPGEVDRAEYQLILPYVAFNGVLGGQWHWVIRAGVGLNTVALKRNTIDASLSPKAVQPEDANHEDGAALMLGFGVEKWVSGVKWGCSMRYITSSVDTRNSLEYMSLGSQQFGCYAQFMLRPFGLI